jgi:hypothetical protein
LKIISSIAALIVFAAALPQEEPVTRGEFIIVFSRFSSAMQRAFVPEMPVDKAVAHGYKGVGTRYEGSLRMLIGAKLWPKGSGQTFGESKTITRYEIALALDKLVAKLRPKFRSQAVVKTYDHSLVIGRKSDGSQAAMDRLVKEDFLPLRSPLFSGKVTFGPTAVGAMFAQFAERLGHRFQNKQ